MLFAEGKPLGEDGLDWLKIHLINLIGLKKRYLCVFLRSVFFIGVGSITI